MAQKYGRFSWQCRHCNKVITKDTPQGLGLAKSNHMRGHQKKWAKESQEAAERAHELLPELVKHEPEVDNGTD